jgi:HEAT repeat protein
MLALGALWAIAAFTPPDLSVWGTAPANQERTDEIEALVLRLATEVPAERRRALEELEKLGPQAVPAALRALENTAPNPAAQVAVLIRQLGSRKWKERDQAMQALVRLGRSAKPLLEEQAASGDPEVAWRVRAALAEIRDRAGRDEMLEELRNAALCDFLGEVGDARGVPLLLRLLAGNAPEPRPDLRLRAANALGKLRPQMEPAQVEEAADHILALLETPSPPLAKGLLIRALGRLRSPACVRPLSALLADRSEKNLDLKRAALAALGEVGNAKGLKAVIEALRSDDPYVRQGAGAVLEEVRGVAGGFNAALPPADNRAALEDYRAWWSKKFGQEWEN